MGLLANDLVSQGHVVTSPTLPGHGGEPDDLLHVGWQDWLHEVARWPTDVIVGQSMGGALALAHAAGGKPNCAGVVAINPPVGDPDALEGLQWMSERGVEWVTAPQLAEGELGYERLPTAALVEMISGIIATDLRAVTVPVLLVTAAHDDVVDPTSADRLAEQLAVSNVRVARLKLASSGHVASLGPEREVMATAIDEFCAGLALS